VVNYSDGKVLQELDRRRDLDDLGDAELESRKRGREEKKTGKYHDLLKKKPDVNDWAVDELKLAIAHKKKITLSSMKGDKKEALRDRWIEVKDLASDVEEERGGGGGGGRGGRRQKQCGQGGGEETKEGGEGGGGTV